MDQLRGGSQCRPVNVLYMVAVLVGQMGSLYVCHNSRRGSICCNVLVVLFFLVNRITQA